MIKGEVFDVAIDIPKDSAIFGKCIGIMLSAKNNNKMLIPEDLSFSVIQCKSIIITNNYSQEYKFCIYWDIPKLVIYWKTDYLDETLLSGIDKIGKLLNAAEVLVN